MSETKNEKDNTNFARILSLFMVVALISTAFVGSVAATTNASDGTTLGGAVCSDSGPSNLDGVESIIAAGLNFLVTAGALMAAVLAILGALTDGDFAIPNIGSVSEWYEPIIGYITFLIIVVAIEIGFSVVFGIDISCLTPSIPGT